MLKNTQAFLDLFTCFLSNYLDFTFFLHEFCVTFEILLNYVKEFSNITICNTIKLMRKSVESKSAVFGMSGDRECLLYFLNLILLSLHLRFSCLSIYLIFKLLKLLNLQFNMCIETTKIKIKTLFG